MTWSICAGRFQLRSGSPRATEGLFNYCFQNSVGSGGGVIESLFFH